MIYFLRAGTDGHVKIGWTKDEATLGRRVRTLQTGQPVKLAIIRTMEAERWAEAWLHGFFSGVRAAGEWFGFDAAMLTVVIPARNPVLVEHERRHAWRELRKLQPARKWRGGTSTTSTRFTLRVPNALLARLEALAEREGITVARALVQAAEGGLDAARTLADARRGAKEGM